MKLLVMRLLLSVIFLLSFLQSALSQNELPKLIVECSGIFNLCGYYNRYTKEEVIPPQFERAMLFEEGLAPVRVKGRYGYIDMKGNMKIAPKYDLAGSFYQGLAEILVGRKTGIINRKGEIVIAPQFSRAIPFTDETALVSEGEWQNIHFEGYERLDGLNEKGAFLNSEPFGLYHIKQGWIIKPHYFISGFENKGRGLIWAKEQGVEKNLFGLLRFDGKWQIPPSYNHVQFLSDGMAVVNQEENSGNAQKIVKWGAVNENGELKVPLVFQHLSYWENEYGIASMNEKAALVDKKGNLLGKRYFDKVERNGKNTLPQVFEQKKWWDINKTGHITEAKQDGAFQVEQQEAFLNKKKVSNTSKENSNHGNNSRRQILRCPGGTSLFKQGEHWGLKKPDGNIIIRPDYHALYCFFQGVIWIPVDKEKQWCPFGIDGKRLNYLACRKTHYPFIQTHSYPESFSKDAYESSVLWLRAYLDYGLQERKEPPKMIPDAFGRGSSSIIRN